MELFIDKWSIPEFRLIRNTCPSWNCLRIVTVFLNLTPFPLTQLGNANSYSEYDSSIECVHFSLTLWLDPQRLISVSHSSGPPTVLLPSERLWLTLLLDIHRSYPISTLWVWVCALGYHVWSSWHNHVCSTARNHVGNASQKSEPSRRVNGRHSAR